MISFLPGKKTYFAVIGGLLVIVGAFVGGEITVVDAATRAFELLGIGGLRLGVQAGLGR